jgi:hypothetical protein
MYTENGMDASPNRQTERPSEFFARYYDKEDDIFNPSFGSPGATSRYSTFKSPINTRRMSNSPIDIRRMSVVQEDNDDGDNFSQAFGSNIRPSQAPLPVRSSSQARFTEFSRPTNFYNTRNNNANNRSMTRLSDNFWGGNRFSNQPNQRQTQKPGLSHFMQDEIIRSGRYDKIKSSLKKKSLAEMVDEIILEKESIYFNPENKPIPVKEHNFQGETPIRGTVHSRATYDPYDITPAKERLTTSNNFNFKEMYDETKKRVGYKNVSFGSAKKDLNRVTRESGISHGQGSALKSSYNKFDNIAVSKLNQLSNSYYDDYDRTIMQRFYLLVHGEPTGIDCQFSVNIFKRSESENTNLKVSIIVKNVNFEYTNDWIMNMAKAVLVYELESNSSPSTFFKRSPWMKIPVLNIIEDFEILTGIKKHKAIQRKIIEMDKLIKNVNFKITFKLDDLKVDGLTDIDSVKYKYKRHIFQLKTEPILIRILKQGLESGICGFGISFTTRNTVEMLWQFVYQLKKAISVYVDNPVIKKGIKFYEEILKDKVSKSGFDRSSLSLLRDSNVKFTSPKKRMFDREDSEIEEEKGTEAKYKTGTKLFRRDYTGEDSVDATSSFRRTPQVYVKPILKTPSVMDASPQPSPDQGSAPASKQKMKTVKSVRKFKKKSKTRTPNDNTKKMINHMVINK